MMLTLSKWVRQVKYVIDIWIKLYGIKTKFNFKSYIVMFINQSSYVIKMNLIWMKMPNHYNQMFFLDTD